MDTTTTPTAEQIADLTAYADRLRATGQAYITASAAVDMDRTAGRREAAEYLLSEGERLQREAAHWDDRAYEMRLALSRPPVAVS